MDAPIQRLTAELGSAGLDVAREPDLFPLSTSFHHVPENDIGPGRSLEKPDFAGVR